MLLRLLRHSHKPNAQGKYLNWPTRYSGSPSEFKHFADEAGGFGEGRQKGELFEQIQEGIRVRGRKDQGVWVRRYMVRQAAGAGRASFRADRRIGIEKRVGHKNHPA